MYCCCWNEDRSEDLGGWNSEGMYFCFYVWLPNSIGESRLAVPFLYCPVMFAVNIYANRLLCWQRCNRTM